MFFGEEQKEVHVVTSHHLGLHCRVVCRKVAGSAAALYKVRNAGGTGMGDFWGCLGAMGDDGLLLVLDVS